MTKRSSRTLPDGSRLEFEFNGGHTVNIYHQGRNVECFSVGDFAEDRATRAQLKRGIEAWTRTLWTERDNYGI